MSITILDGGMGQELIARAGRATSLWSVQALLDAPEMVREVHDGYFAAGAEIATANTYSVLPDRRAPHGRGARGGEVRRGAMYHAVPGGGWVVAVWGGWGVWRVLTWWVRQGVPTGVGLLNGVGHALADGRGKMTIGFEHFFGKARESVALLPVGGQHFVHGQRDVASHGLGDQEGDPLGPEPTGGDDAGGGLGAQQHLVGE